LDKLPPGVTLVALPYVSKSGFFGATVQSIVTGILARGFPMCKFLFLGDHTQVHARNMACKDAMELGAEWVFFIDSDMDFPTDTLARLKACDADIACTDMWSRGWPSFRTVMRLSEPREDGLKQAVPVPGSPTGVERVDVCGMACTLIRTSLLRRVAEKWPDQPLFWSGQHGEDATFCFKALEVGATMKCDFDVVAGHWGVTAMRGQEYTRDPKNQPMKIDPASAEMLKRMNEAAIPQTQGVV
jgi:hypothetical protein